eukprot:TRINITY_DN558_c0_g1_i2.p1 TRINITY_DN558_c0_g1~~TRINITY_DN558_c0_g1_i2.p1  ORF type:complete len:278 (+),score=52.95 TRINITY_DN558_c0_g1_i2:465-1298(+)
MDEIILQTCTAEGWTAGTTGVITLVLDSKLYAANVGDSEACLIRVHDDDSISALNLTRIHKADDPVEKDRILKLGGYVIFGRVFGSLAMSRALGDPQFKKPKAEQNFVIAEPHILEVDLNPITDKFIIVACDGLWDVMKHQEAGAFIYNLYKSGKNLNQIAQELAQRAIELPYSQDNVTAVIIELKWDPEYIKHVKEEQAQELAKTNVNESSPKDKNDINIESKSSLPPLPTEAEAETVEEKSQFKSSLPPLPVEDNSEKDTPTFKPSLPPLPVEDE